MKFNIAGTCIIQNTDGKFLIVRRSKKSKKFPGMWTVPGGKLEQRDIDDSIKIDQFSYFVIENLIKREVYEETNLSLSNLKFITNMTYDNSNFVFSYTGQTNDKDIILSNELIDYAWITLKEAKKYNLIGGIYEELEMVKNQK